MRSLLILAACSSICVSSSWAADAPQAKLVETSHDHGTVFVGTTINGNIYVENTGTVPFKITQAKTSCHCTTAVPSKGAVAPGGRGEITYEISTTSLGKSVKNITVYTDPPVAEPLMFTASVTFAPFIESDPKDLNLEISQGDPLNARIPLHIAKGVEGIKILDAKTRSRDVKASLGGAANGADQTLVVQAVHPLPAGKRTIPMELEFDKGGPGVQNINVTIRVIPAVLISPTPINVIFGDGKNEATVPITLTNTKGNKFTIASITPRGIEIRNAALPKDPAVEQKIDVTFVRPAEHASLRGFLNFQFNDDLGMQTVFTIFRQNPPPRPNIPVVAKPASK